MSLVQVLILGLFSFVDSLDLLNDATMLLLSI